MTRGKSSPKITKKKGGSKNHPIVSAAPSVGKKRKKKQLNGEKPSVLLPISVVSGEVDSSSSLDKPSMKQGRFDCSSSDLMATDLTNSSVVMDTGSVPHNSHTPTNFTPSTDTSTLVAQTTSYETLLSSERSHDSCTIAMDRSQDLVAMTIADTDRWGVVCSDEEQEQQRLEIYKKNRRKRYQSALEEKLSVAPQVDYYSTTSHPQ